MYSYALLTSFTAIVDRIGDSIVRTAYLRVFLDSGLRQGAKF